MWRVWIEMMNTGSSLTISFLSPSVWRVWIEIITWTLDKEMIDRVTLRVEGVD